MRWVMATMFLAFALAGCADYSYELVHREATTPGSAQSDVVPQAVAIETPPVATASSPRSLHVRLLVVDPSGEPMHVIAAEQRVRLPDGRQVAGSAATATAEVAPYNYRAVDLFFPLPPDVDRASKLPKFKLDWKIDKEHGAEAGQATFDRTSRGPTMPCGPTADPICLSNYSSIWTPAVGRAPA